MSLWIRLCNHTYIHTYNQYSHSKRPTYMLHQDIVMTLTLQNHLQVSLVCKYTSSARGTRLANHTLHVPDLVASSM